MRFYLGLTLVLAGALYLVLTHPGLPGWAWGLGFGLGFLFAAKRTGREAYFWLGSLFLGWALGAFFADLLGLVSLRLLGLAAGLLVAGWLEAAPAATYVGAALLMAALAVGLFEVGAAPWVGLILLVLGAWLLLRQEPEPARGTPRFEARYKKLLAWRKARAEAEHKRTDEVLSDEEVARLARAEDKEAIERALSPEHLGYVEELALLLLEANKP
jgi:hypothetical protein